MKQILLIISLAFCFAGFGQITPSYVNTLTNGLTKSGSTGRLGGALTANTVVSFTPSARYLAFGDMGSSTAMGFGNLIGGSTVIFTVNNADLLNLSTPIDSDGAVSKVGLDRTDGVTNVGGITNVKSGAWGFDYGLINYNPEKQYGTHKRITNMYYGRHDGSGNTLDLMRVEVGYNYADYDSSSIHGRMYIDTLEQDTFNGWHIATDYAQLEYHKTDEDDQASGTLVVVNANGLSFYVGGTRIFRVPNALTIYADDAAAVTGGLTTGDAYITTTGGSTFFKVIP